MKNRFYSRFLFLVTGLILAVVIFVSVLSSLAQQQFPLNLPTPNAIDLQPGNSPLTPQEPEVVFPTPICRAGVNQFDTAIGQLATLGDLQSIRAAIQRAVADNDQLLGQYLTERLTELIGQDPNRALAVIAWMESAQGPELGVYMRAVQGAAVHNPQVAERLLTMAEQRTDPPQRVAALMALRTHPSLTVAQLDRLAALGKDKTAEQVALAATGVIGHVMRNDSDRFEEYVAHLLDIAESQVGLAVVYLAVELSGVYTQTSFGNVSRQRLANIVLHHPAKDVRIEAALVLSTARDTEAVLQVYRQAFQENADLCLRWNMMKFATRAAGAKALPLLEQFAVVDPRLQKDYLDFKDIYASGSVDWEQVWLAKNEKGEHLCDMAP